MATDAEARSTGNSAMVIALVTLVLLVIGAVAYFGMGNRTADAPDTTTIVTQPNDSPDVTIQAPPVIVNGGGGTSGGGTTGGTGGGTSGGATGGGTTGGTGGGGTAGGGSP